VQRFPDGTTVVSATDLVGFLACDHLSTLELGRVEGLWDRPHRREDLTVQLMQDRGDAHELAHLERLRESGKRIIAIEKEGLTTPERLRAAEATTLAAMRDGADVIFQATFFDGRWRGHADFLYKVERPSDLGGWSYDIADTKLARGVKASAILQMCVYADLLERLQGTAPQFVYVVTGDGVEHAHRLADYGAYYRFVKSRFEQRVLAGSAGATTYPDPVDHCRVCVWYPTCITRRRTDDHPSIVAGMRRVDTERLIADEITTVRALAALPADRAVPDMRSPALTKLRNQARLQLVERDTGNRVFELIEPQPADPGRGLASLPEPNPFDVFLDLEADPWALDDGLEYLIGSVVNDTGVVEYIPLWGHDRAGEKAAFEQLIDMVVARLDAHPEMHLYHYGGYESGAIKRLMQRHATRQDEVDRLLRAGTLVDLLNVVRQGVRASVESYSLKQIEKFYMPVRQGPVTEAGFSVVEYERWMREHDQSILDDIAAYNRDDCVSTLMLRDWLEGRRTEAVTKFPDADWTRPALGDGLPTETQSARMAEVQIRVDALMAGLPADRRERTADEQARWLLAGLLDWHRRDEKPAWWLWHDLREKSLDDLIESGDGIAGLEFVGDIEMRKKSVVRRYRFKPQDHKFRVGEKVIDPNPRFGDRGDDAGEIIALDDVHGTIDLLRGPSRMGYHPEALIPGKPFGTGPMPDALLRVADHILANGIEGPGSYRAVRDVLLRRPPRINGIPDGGALSNVGLPMLDTAEWLTLRLDQTTLPIQGPPGTGKTYTGARMILRLLAEGKKVGITAQSHKAISNLLQEVCRASIGPPVRLRAIQKCGTGDEVRGFDAVAVTDDNDVVDRALTEGSANLVAGTPWLFARPEMEGRLDTLFVDEAGQLSLANVVAVGTSTTSMVLLGDPNQLPQVSQGVHPEGVGISALEHLSGGADTIDPRLGLFLNETWRMHPAVNGYVSDMFYDGRLRAEPSTAIQRVTASDPALDGAGIRYLPRVHAANSSWSRIEAETVAETISALVGRGWTDADGHTRPLSINDIIVVAPYNAHVAAIHSAVELRTGLQARVGTVDKFQGQEGAVAIYSMASSSQDDAPRAMDFLYSRNRLNVAISRARAIAILVASPELMNAECHTPEQMRMVNALCRLLEVASHQATEVLTG
jgi:predicted RecB family nuclease